jgi:hypothetical protein
MDSSCPFRKRAFSFERHQIIQGALALAASALLPGCGSPTTSPAPANRQLTAGASGPSLSTTSGVTLQGASVGANGSFSPNAAYTLSASGTELTCYVPYLSAVLIHVP